MVTVGMATLVGLTACGGQTPAEKKIDQPNEPKVEAERPKACSDYASGQEIFIDEEAGKLTKADKKSLDKDGNGYYCDEPGTKWKDTRTKVAGLPPFDVPFTSGSGTVNGVKATEMTIDISEVDRPSEAVLRGISQEALKEVGEDYEYVHFTYRDAESMKELDAFGAYIDSPETAEAVNEQIRAEGAEIDFYDASKVPEGGGVEVFTFY
jgi:hypothetical protein